MSRGPVLLVDMAPRLVERIAPGLRAAGHDLLVAGPAVEGIPSWDAEVASVPARDVAGRVDTMVQRLQQGLDADAISAFETRSGNPLKSDARGLLEKIVQLASMQIASLDRFERLLEVRPPAALVFGCDNAHGQRALIQRAREQGIPSLQVAHSIYGSLRLLSYAGNMDTLYADHIAAGGAVAREHMMHLGNEGDRIHATGILAWDEFYEEEQRPDRETACRELGLDPQRPVFLFTFGYGEGASAFYRLITERFARFHEAIGRACSKLPQDAQILLRPHPQELRRHEDKARQAALEGAYLDHVRSLCDRDLKLSRGSAATSIRAADVVTSIGSSSMIPIAMILERPVVSLPWTDDDDHSFHLDHGVLIAESDDDLGAFLRMLVTEGPARERVLEKHQEALPLINHGHDGRAAERVVALIDELAVGEPDASPNEDEDERRSIIEIDEAGPFVQLLLDPDDEVAAARLQHDVDVLTAAAPIVEDEELPHPIVQVYGLPRTRARLDELRALRQGKRRVIWTPAGAGEGEPELVKELVGLADRVVFACRHEARQLISALRVEEIDRSIIVPGIAIERRASSGAPTGSLVLVGERAEHRATAELGDLELRLARFRRVAQKSRARALFLSADAPFDLRVLERIMDGLPVIAEVDSWAFELLDPELRVVGEDPGSLRSAVAARLLAPDSWFPSTELRSRFLKERAGRDLLRLHRRA